MMSAKLPLNYTIRKAGMARRVDSCTFMHVRSKAFPAGHMLTKGRIPLRYPGFTQVRSWLQTCSELEFGLSSSSLTLTFHKVV